MIWLAGRLACRALHGCGESLCFGKLARIEQPFVERLHELAHRGEVLRRPGRLLTWPGLKPGGNWR
jgi:hypothetical protein